MISMFNMNNGYVGWSMSRRAQQAYDDGEMPLSKWSKSVLLDVIHEYRDYNELNFDVELLKKLTLNTLKDKFLKYSSWHHTSKFCNCTDFYAIDEDVIAELTNDKIKDMIKEEKAEKVKEKAWKKRLEEETSQATKDFMNELKKKGYEVSNSFHYYLKGRKPSSCDVHEGLDKFFEKGEKRLFKFAATIPYIEIWNGEKWVKECDFNVN